MFFNKPKCPGDYPNMLEGIRHDDPEAFADMYRKLLCCLPLKFEKHIRSQGGTEEDAKDLFIDTILLFREKIKAGKFKYQGDQELEAFVTKLFKGLWSTTRRKNNRMDTYEEKDLVQDMEFELEPEFEKRLEIRDILTQLIDQLGDICKRIIQYAIYDDLELSKIRELMGYTDKAGVSNQKYRCIQKMTQMYQNKRLLLWT